MIHPEAVKKILLLRPDSIGDAVLASSMLPYIKSYYANASLTVLCQQHLIDLYQACHLVNEVVGFDKTTFMTNESYRGTVLDSLTQHAFDLVLHAVYSRERAMDCLATSIGAPYTVAFKTNRDQDDTMYTHCIESSGTLKLELDRYNDFLSGLSITHGKLEPQVWLSAEDEQYADDFFTKHGLTTDTTIALFAGALSGHRMYHHYGKALAKVLAHQKSTVIAFGGLADYNVNQLNLNDIAGQYFNLSGATTLRQTAALIKRCSLAVGAETGLAHVACAVGIPHVVILGGGHFGRFMPYSPLTSAVVVPLQCYGCDWRCQYKRAHCVQAVTVDMLALVIQESMRTRSLKPRIFIQPKGMFSGGLLWGPRWGLEYVGNKVCPDKMSIINC